MFCVQWYAEPFCGPQHGQDSMWLFFGVTPVSRILKYRISITSFPSCSRYHPPEHIAISLSRRVPGIGLEAHRNDSQWKWPVHAQQAVHATHCKSGRKCLSGVTKTRLYVHGNENYCADESPSLGTDERWTDQDIPRNWTISWPSDTQFTPPSHSQF
jgi:hypothetical protein